MLLHTVFKKHLRWQTTRDAGLELHTFPMTSFYGLLLVVAMMSTVKASSTTYMYRVLSKGAAACPEGLGIDTECECESALKQLGLNHSKNYNGNLTTIPRQCSHGTLHDMIWNRAPTGQGRADIRPICKAGVHVSQHVFTKLPFLLQLVLDGNLVLDTRSLVLRLFCRMDRLSLSVYNEFNIEPVVASYGTVFE